MLREHVLNLMQEKETLAAENKQLARANRELQNELLKMKEVITENNKRDCRAYDALTKILSLVKLQGS